MNKFEILCELCRLAEIKTFEDLKYFQKDYAIKRPTLNNIITALNVETEIRRMENE